MDAQELLRLLYLGRLTVYPLAVASVIVLAILLWFIPFAALVAAIRQAPVGLLAGALAVFVACHVVAALKWRLLQGSHAGLSRLATFRAHFAGVVANLWLPGVVGGDLVRVGAAYRQARKPTAVAVASLVDRLIDSAALVAIAATFSVIRRSTLSRGAILAAAWHFGRPQRPE